MEGSGACKVLITMPGTPMSCSVVVIRIPMYSLLEDMQEKRAVNTDQDGAGEAAKGNPDGVLQTTRALCLLQV